MKKNLNKGKLSKSHINNRGYNKYLRLEGDITIEIDYDKFEEIADNPMLGKNYDGIADQLFGFRAGRHIIFYRILNKNFIEITRILHEQMDLKNRM